jgi:hypothetical protein
MTISGALGIRFAKMKHAVSKPAFTMDNPPVVYCITAGGLFLMRHLREAKH